MVAVVGVGRGSADLGSGLRHAHRLVRVLDVRMLAGKRIATVQVLEDDDLLILKPGAVELEGNRFRPIGSIGRELHLAFDGRVSDEQLLARAACSGGCP